ncbi:MAG TPA: VapC toxin family PIN domain ribonuclease [Verrucomicrobia bacterium]|nr:MAG: hypothetical protein A2X46_14770 [Lentisphaerae bacterium GWF2_57_35]HBA84005.1 VapC toxin family PIN domain ribonuclease [Verrucomicrobiota bacterium]
MVIVDTSAWIEFFQNANSEVAQKVDQALEQDLIGIGDLIYCEVMQGLYHAEQQDRISKLLLSLPQFEMVGFQIAAKSASNYRRLRTKGVTIRKTIDVLIGTFCAENGHHLIHNDRDFDLMASHIGLKVL